MTGAVLRKELVSLWATPVPYVVGAAFHVVLGILMANQLEVRQQAVLQPLFPLAGFLLLVAVPVLAMRTFAEELRSGTLDVLLAVPVPPRPLVVGKWLATWLTALAVLTPAGLTVVLVQLWGAPDTGPAVAGFLGLALLAGALAGIGVAASSMTSSQPVAAMVTLSIVLVLWFAHVGSDTLDAGSVLAAVSLSERLRTFAGGAVDRADVVYYGSVALGAMALACVALDLRRMR